MARKFQVLFCSIRSVVEKVEKRLQTPRATPPYSVMQKEFFADDLSIALCLGIALQKQFRSQTVLRSMAVLHRLGRAFRDVRTAALIEDADMIENEISDLLFIVQDLDRKAARLENSLSWYQSMNRLMERDTSMPNILASLYCIADYYLSADYPRSMIEAVVRRAEIVFFSILKQTSSAKSLHLQMPVVFYVRLGLFDDALRVAGLTVQIVHECFDFESKEDREKSVASLERILIAPIESRMIKIRKTRRFLHQFITPDEQMPVVENALEVAWDQYLALCENGICDMPIS